MAKYKYKNISNQYLFVPGIGDAKPGDVLESDVELRSQSLKLVEESAKKSKPKKDKKLWLKKE